MTEQLTRHFARSYLIETIAGIALCYFLLGGSEWNPAVWALFSVAAVAIVLRQVFYDSGRMGEQAYEKWRLVFGFSIITVLLVAGLLDGSPWAVGLGLVCGWVWIKDLRYYRSKFRELRAYRDEVARRKSC